MKYIALTRLGLTQLGRRLTLLRPFFIVVYVTHYGLRGRFLQPSVNPPTSTNLVGWRDHFNARDKAFVG